jgi:hypothetical protein
MCPSVYASQLAPSIASALKFLNQELTPPAAFVPSQHRLHADCDHRFHRVLRLSDADAPPAAEAPGLRFELRYLPHSPALTELLAGEVDLPRVQHP